MIILVLIIDTCRCSNRSMRENPAVNYNVINATECKDPALFELSRDIMSIQNGIRVNHESFNSEPSSWPLDKIACVIKRPNEMHVDWDVLWNYDVQRVMHVIKELGIDVLYQRSESRCNPIYEEGLKSFKEKDAFMPYNAGICFFSSAAASFAEEDMRALQLSSFEECCTYEQLILPSRMKKAGLSVCTLEDILCFLRHEMVDPSWWDCSVFEDTVKVKIAIPQLRFFHFCGTWNERYDYNVLYDFLNGSNFVQSVGLGDVVESVAQPIARVIDNLAGTNLQECNGCKNRKKYLNEKFPIT